MNSIQDIFMTRGNVQTMDHVATKVAMIWVYTRKVRLLQEN